MLNAAGALRLLVVVDEIVISLPGTSYSVNYYKPFGSPQLIARRLPRDNDGRVQMTQVEFLAESWLLTNAKAHELGWIV
jgi:hypothetical protein